MKDKKIFEEIMQRIGEAVHYKITMDIMLYGVCILDVGNQDDLDEIVKIRKMLDKDINWENMIKEIKATKINRDTVTNKGGNYGEKRIIY